MEHDFEGVLACVGPQPFIGPHGEKLLVLEGGPDAPVLFRVNNASIARVRPPPLSAFFGGVVNVELRGEVVDVNKLFRPTTGDKQWERFSV